MNLTPIHTATGEICARPGSEPEHDVCAEHGVRFHWEWL